MLTPRTQMWSHHDHRAELSSSQAHWMDWSETEPDQTQQTHLVLTMEVWDKQPLLPFSLKKLRSSTPGSFDPLGLVRPFPGLDLSHAAQLFWTLHRSHENPMEHSSGSHTHCLSQNHFNSLRLSITSLREVQLSFQLGRKHSGGGERRTTRDVRDPVCKSELENKIRVQLPSVSHCCCFDTQSSHLHPPMHNAYTHIH